MTDQLSIGALAARSRVSIHSIRFYERSGLLTPSSYSESGYRFFDQDTLATIRFIKNAQKYDFSLEEIGNLLRCRCNKSGCGNACKTTVRKLRELTSETMRLRKISESLKCMVKEKKGRSPSRVCPVLWILAADVQHPVSPYLLKLLLRKRK